MTDFSSCVIEILSKPELGSVSYVHCYQGLPFHPSSDSSGEQSNFDGPHESATRQHAIWQLDPLSWLVVLH